MTSSVIFYRMWTDHCVIFSHQMVQPGVYIYIYICVCVCVLAPLGSAIATRWSSRVSVMLGGLLSSSGLLLSSLCSSLEGLYLTMGILTGNVLNNTILLYYRSIYSIYIYYIILFLNLQYMNFIKTFTFLLCYYSV